MIESQDTAQRVTKIALAAAFGSAVLLFSRRRKVEPLTVIDCATMGLAVTRLGRLTAHDLIAEPLRAAVAKTQQHEHYGETTEPRYSHGALASLGQLITCPVCAGTWWAAALTFGMSLAPNVTRVFVRIQAMAGAAEFIDAVIEAGCWLAAAARRYAGQKN